MSMHFFYDDISIFFLADLGGHKVFVGSRVNVRWKGDWYAGRVLKLGPKRNLCRVI